MRNATAKTVENTLDIEELELEIIEALKQVYDPEIPVNIYDLGLIYDLQISAAGRVDIRMTLTAPACPVAGAMPEWVKGAVESVPGVQEVHVELTFDPPWSTELMSMRAKLELNMF